VLVSRRPAHKIYSPHQRVEPPGTTILSSPATVPMRELAKATRDKRANNILCWGMSCGERERKGGEGGGTGSDNGGHVPGLGSRRSGRARLAALLTANWIPSGQTRTGTSHFGVQSRIDRFSRPPIWSRPTSRVEREFRSATGRHRINRDEM